jgi:colicin import membrane protein
MRILPRPIGALVLVAIAAAAYGGYERLTHRSPSRVAEVPKAAAQPPMPPEPPAAIAAARAPAESPPVEPPAHMTSAQQAGFDAWLIKTYLACWKPARQPVDADVYVAQVRLAYNPDGSLSKPAKLVNPPADPALKPQAKSVLAAVQTCNPLTVPAQYRPYYEQWRTKTIHFDPQIAAR